MADDRAETAMERLVADHHQAVYRYAYRLTGSGTDAEDLTQEVFLVAQQRLQQLRRPDRARGWLFAILRSCFVAAWRRQEAVPAAALGLDLDGLPAQGGDGGSVDGVWLRQALGELPPEFRVVVVMFYFDDCSYREIAEQLDVPMGTVMSRLARAKQHLRSRLLREETPAAGAAGRLAGGLAGHGSCGPKRRTRLAPGAHPPAEPVQPET
jgi:RNA polymerase sigma-70 factor (ECF subfamily)